MKELKLIQLYYYFCQCYNSKLSGYCQHFSNNSKPSNEKITDEELLTVYFYCRVYEKRHEKKAIYDYAVRYLSSWFPSLPAYANFNNRLNNLSAAIAALMPLILADILDSKHFDNQSINRGISLMDSMPIVLCSGRRKAKVAPELSDKTFCASKQMWYYGVKLHCVAFKRQNTLPFPEYITFTPASSGDLEPVLSFLLQTPNRIFIGDKIYRNEEVETQLAEIQSFIQTPVKKKQNKCLDLQQFDHAADKHLSALVSGDRQPIESFFASLNHKTAIQTASKVRSPKGITFHLYAALAAFFFTWLFSLTHYSHY